MFGSRRLAKRSIVGTQVCVPWIEDGRYYVGQITSTSEWANGQEVYNVYIPHHKVTKTFQDCELIGPGFQTISIAYLKKGQRVYITHNSREICGTVLSHDRENDDVLIEIEVSPGEVTPIICRLEEVRLVESRRSARLQDHRGTNYSQIADLSFHKRIVSSCIDVPPSRGKYRSNPAIRSLPTSISALDEEDEECSVLLDDSMELEDDSSVTIKYNHHQINQLGSVVSHNQVDGGRGEESDSEVMDDTMAAMVLTSLSCSPLSPVRRPGGDSPLTAGSSVSTCSSGVWSSQQSSPSSSHNSDSKYLSTSAPASHFTNHFITSPAHKTAPTSADMQVFPGDCDEGIELDHTHELFHDTDTQAANTRKRRLSTKTIFKCLWPGCSKLYNTVNAIECHVRQVHLGPKKRPMYTDESDDSLDSVSDHEEEFYYTEVEVSVDTMTQTFADMYTSSSPPGTQIYGSPNKEQIAFLARPQLTDHDYQKKSVPLSIPHSSHKSAISGGSLPASLSKVPRSASWSTHTNNKTKAKSNSHARKPRSETKKCRKYYGMENRELWCTQCRWKKACTRFLDYHTHNNKIRQHDIRPSVE